MTIGPSPCGLGSRGTLVSIKNLNNFAIHDRAKMAHFQQAGNGSVRIARHATGMPVRAVVVRSFVR